MFDPKLLIVLARLFMFADIHGVDVTITSMHSGREHLKTVSKTHQEYRAMDIRSSNWPEELKLELVEFLQESVGYLGAISSLNGERRVIVYEDHATHGQHFHIQVERDINPFLPKNRNYRRPANKYMRHVEFYKPVYDRKPFYGQGTH